MNKGFALFILGTLFLSFVAAETFYINEQTNTKFSTKPNQRNVKVDGAQALPGLDTLGFGVNILNGIPGKDPAAYTAPLYKWAFTEGTEYFYPLRPDFRYRVPDEVYVRTLAHMDSTSYFFDNVDQYIETLHLSVGLGLDITMNKNKTNDTQTNPTPGPTPPPTATPTASPTAAPASSNSSITDLTGSNTTSLLSTFSLNSFTGSLDIAFNRRHLEFNQGKLIINSLKSKLWQMVIGPELELRPSVQRALDKVKEGDNALAFYNFFTTYGTHFIESVVLGGSLDMTVKTTNDTDLTGNELTILAQTMFDAAFGLGANGVGVNVNLGVNYTNQYLTFTTTSDASMTATGGDPDLGNFFSGTVDSAESFVHWLASLPTNAATVDVRVRPHSYLFVPLERARVDRFIELYVSTAGNWNAFRDQVQSNNL